MPTSGRSSRASFAAAPVMSSSSPPSNATSAAKGCWPVTDLLVHERARPTAPTGRVIGTDAPRKEDSRLLSGAGRFTDDLEPARLAEMAVGRCPYPRARIRTIDCTQAQRISGVLQILTGTEVAARTAPIGILRPVPGAPTIPQFALAGQVAIYEGQPVVSVTATSRH